LRFHLGYEFRSILNASADGGSVGFVASVFVCLRDKGLGGTADTSGYEGIVVGLTLGLEDVGVVGRIGQTFSESARIVRFALDLVAIADYLRDDEAVVISWDIIFSALEFVFVGRLLSVLEAKRVGSFLSRGVVKLELHGDCEVIVAASFNVFSLHEVLLVLHQILPVTHRLLVLVGRKVLTPFSHGGERNFLQHWVNWVSRVEGVGLVHLELTVVITSDVEPVSSSFWSLEIALEKVAEVCAPVAKSFEGCEGR